MPYQPNSRRYSLSCLGFGAFIGAGVWYTFWTEIAGQNPLDRIQHPLLWASLVVLTGFFSVMSLFTLTLFRVSFAYLVVGLCVSGVIWFLLPPSDTLTVGHLLLLGIPVAVSVFAGLVVRSGRLFDTTHATCPNCTDPRVPAQYKGSGCNVCGGAGVVAAGTNFGVVVVILLASAGLCYALWGALAQAPAAIAD